MTATCHICWQPVTRRKRAWALRCNHAYHRGCLNEWHNIGRAGCPICDRGREPPAPEIKPCPNCGISIEKIGGCNNMHCEYCEADFNWATGAVYYTLPSTLRPHRYLRMKNAYPPAPRLYVLLLFLLMLLVPLLGIIVQQHLDHKAYLDKDTSTAVIDQNINNIETEIQELETMRRELLGQRSDLRSLAALQQRVLQRQKHMLDIHDFLCLFLTVVTVNLAILTSKWEIPFLQYTYPRMSFHLASATALLLFFRY